MEGKSGRVIIGAISVFIALVLAWRIGLWLEPEPRRESLPAASQPAGQDPPFATGKVRENFVFSLREVRATAEGTVVEALGVVPYDIERQDVKPAAVAMLRLLKEKFPLAQQLRVTMVFAKEFSQLVIAEVEHDKGRTLVRYGIPTMEQIEENNRKIGSAEVRGGAGETVRLSRPDREGFAAGLDVLRAMALAADKDRTLGNDKLLERAATATGLPYVVARRHHDFLLAYYTGSRFGEEVFSLSLRR